MLIFNSENSDEDKPKKKIAKAADKKEASNSVASNETNLSTPSTSG